MSSSCLYTTAKGLPCRGKARSGRQWCPLHDPELRDAVAAGRKLGGHRRRRATTTLKDSEIPTLDSVESCRELLRTATRDLLSAEGSHLRARGLVQVATAAFQLVRETEIEARIAELEQALERQGGLRRIGR